LRPSGKVNINGTVYDVVAEGVFVNKNAKVTVVSVEGERIVCREVDGGLRG